MKKVYIFLIILFSTSLFACQSSTPDEKVLEESEENSIVEMSSEDDVFALRASFMSDNRGFVYTFDYDGNLLKLLDHHFEGASEYGPSFRVEGGAEIVGSTDLQENIVFHGEYSVVSYGPYQVDRYSMVQADCELEYGVLPYGNEALVLRLKVCPDQDKDLAMQAFESLFEGLMLEKL